MIRNVITCGVALTLLTACAVNPESYKIGTKNGKDLYQLDINGTSKSTYNTQLKHWGTQFCPQGYDVVDSKFDSYQRSTISPVTYTWYKVTIACQ